VKPQAFTMPTCIMVKMVDFFCLSFRYLPHFLMLFLMLSFSRSLTLSQRLERRLEVQLVDSAAEDYDEVRIFVSLTIRSDQSKFSLFHVRINLSSISLIIFQSHYLFSLSLYALVMSLLISLSLPLSHI
jgi:hypothetical protein